MITRFFTSWWGWTLAIVLVVGILSVAPNVHAAANPDLDKLLANDFQRELTTMYVDQIKGLGVDKPDTMKRIQASITNYGLCALHAEMIQTFVPQKADVAKKQQEAFSGHYRYLVIALDRLGLANGQQLLDQKKDKANRKLGIDKISDIYVKAAEHRKEHGKNTDEANNLIIGCDNSMGQTEKMDKEAARRINLRKAEQDAQRAAAELAEVFMPKQSAPAPVSNADYSGESGYQQLLQCSSYLKQHAHYIERAREEDKITRRLNGQFQDARRDADHHYKKHEEYAPYTNTQSLIDLAEKHYRLYSEAHDKAGELADESNAQADYVQELAGQADGFARKFNTECKDHLFSGEVLDRACTNPNSKSVDFCRKLKSEKE